MAHGLPVGAGAPIEFGMSRPMDAEGLEDALEQPVLPRRELAQPLQRLRIEHARGRRERRARAAGRRRIDGALEGDGLC